MCGAPKPKISIPKGTPRLMRGDSFKTSTSYSKWSCPTCTYKNSPGNKRCDVCGHMRKKKTDEKQQSNPETSSSGNPDKWSCKWCTYCNRKDLSECMVCRRPKQAQLAVGPERSAKTPSIKQVKPDQWRCLRCTLVNKIKDSVCSACSTPKPKTGNDMKRNTISTGGGGGGYKVPKNKGNGWEVSRLGGAKKMQQENEAKQTWKTVMAVCSAKDRFTDDAFMPGPRSMGYHQDGRKYEWRRPEQIGRSSAMQRGGGGNNNNNNTWCVIRDDMQPSDLQQGELGDCWFLSALAVIAERPELITQLMVTKQYNRVGAYQMMFCKDGKWQNVLVDDYIPITSWGAIAFARGKRNQLWPSLLEKGYAKMYKSYTNIKGGHVHEALADLTGAPCESVRLDKIESDSDIIFARMVSFKQSGFLMGASCGNTQAEQQLFKKVGLQMNHAYSILDVRIGQ
eukprot:jgi/Bigna1/70672/fgenesh1_pg.12_\